MKKFNLTLVLVLQSCLFFSMAQVVTPIEIKNEIKSNSIAETNGAFAAPVEPPASVGDIQKAGSASVTVSPNPATDHINIQININASLKEVSLYDITGKLIRTISNSQISPGTDKLIMNRENLFSGAYFLVVKTDSENFCRRIIFN